MILEKIQGSVGMVFTGIVYKSESRVQKTSVTIIAENFEQARKKLLAIYGKNLISIIFEIEKNSVN